MNEKEVLLDEVSKVIEEDSLSVSFVKNVVFCNYIFFSYTFSKNLYSK